MQNFEPFRENRGLFVGYRIAEDLPATKLVLQWQGPSPRFWRRALPLPLLILASGVICVVLWLMFAEDVRQLAGPGRLNLNLLVPAAFAIVMVLVVGYRVFKSAFQMCHGQGYWQSLAWDAGRNEFRGHYLGLPFLGGQTTTIPLAEMGNTSVSIGPEGSWLVLVDMRIPFSQPHSDVELKLVVEHVDRRVEAMDLLFRIARIAKISDYMVHGNTPRRLELSLLRVVADAEYDDEDEFDDEAPEDVGENTESEAEHEANDEEFDFKPLYNVQRVPEDRSYARYESNTAELGFNEPLAHAIPKFRPAQLKNEVIFTKLAVWEPGQLVRIERPAWPWAMCLRLPLAGGAVAGLVAAWPAAEFVAMLVEPAVVSKWVVFAAVAPVVAAALFVYLWPRMLSREVVFDWQNRVVKWRHGSHSQERSLSAVQGLSLGGVRSSRRSFDGQRRMTKTQHEARAQLQMMLFESDEVVIETDTWESHYEKSFKQLLPFTVALAQALNVPWSVAADTRDTPRGELPGFGRGPAVALSLALLMLVSLVGWRGYVRFAANRADMSALTGVQQLGGKVELVASRSFRDLHELKNARRVTFPNGLDDTGLLAALDTLARVRRLDLDLSGTAITDASAGGLANLDNLVALDLSGTRITNAGIEHFFRLNNVEILNLSGTGVGENGISTCAMIGKLQVLHANNTQASDNTMLNLRIRSELKYVSIAGSLVTLQGADGLRGALPKVVVEGERR